MAPNKLNPSTTTGTVRPEGPTPEDPGTKPRIILEEITLEVEQLQEAIGAF